MIFLKKTAQTILACLVTILLFSACEKFQGDVRVPAYLHLDRIVVGPQTQMAPSPEPGFYTSTIDAAQVICYFQGDAAETNLGVYQLPFTAPILHHGPIQYVKIVPVVKQNGMSSTRIAYPYYQTIQLDNITTAPDSVTNLGKYIEADSQWVLTAHYFPLSNMNVLIEDYFEPTSFSTNFDTNLTWVHDSASAACTGKGFGMLVVPDTVQVSNFTVLTSLNPRVGQYLYLEMDYQTDLDLDVNILGFRVNSEGSATTVPVMRLIPNTRWQKIYINLGRAWSNLNYNTPITLFFQAVNLSGTGGTVRIDNVKVIAQ